MGSGLPTYCSSSARYRLIVAEFCIPKRHIIHTALKNKAAVHDYTRQPIIQTKTSFSIFNRQEKANAGNVTQKYPLQPGIQNGRHEKSVCINLIKLIIGNIISKSEMLKANRLQPRSGPTYVDPDLGYNLFSTVQTY